MKKLPVMVLLAVSLGAALDPCAVRSVAQEPGRAELVAAFNKGMDLRKQGKDAEAIPFLEKAATLAPKVYGADHLETARITHFLASAYRGAGRPREAEPHYLRVLAIREARLGKDDLLIAVALNNLGILYRDLGRLKEAEIFYRRGLKMYEAKLGGEHKDLAQPLHNMAGLFLDLVRYEEAEALLNRSLQIRAANKEADGLAAAATMNSLGVLYHRQRRLAEAERFLRRGLAIFQAKQGPESVEAANSLNSLGALCKDLANYTEAESLYRRSLEIREKKLGKDHPLVANSLNNLASLCHTLGRNHEAETLYRRNLRILEARMGKDSVDVATALNNLAALYDDMRRFEEAGVFLRRSLEIRETKLGKDHPAVAATLNNLGAHYDAMHQPEKAESYLRRCLQITEARFGKDHFELCSPLNNLGSIYRDTKRFKEADLYFCRSLQIAETQLGKDHPRLVPYLHNLAKTSWKLKRLQEAEDLAERCLQISREKLGETHPHVIMSLNTLAWIHQGRNRSKQALSVDEQCLQLTEARLQEVFSFASESAILTYLDTMKGALPTMLDLAAHADEPGPAATTAYNWTLRLKGTALDTLCRYRQAQHLVAPDDALAQRVARYRSLKQLQANAALTPPQGLKPDQSKDQLAKWRQEAEEVEVELNRAFAKKYSAPATDGAALTAAALQQRLAPNSALVEFVRALVIDYEGLRWNGYHYYAFVLTPGATAPQLIDLGPAKAIEDGVRSVRQQITNFQEKLRECESPAEIRALEKQEEKQFLKVCADLHARLMTPLQKALGSAKLLYIAADSDLNRLPFEALVDADGKYLVETYRCTYLSSGRDLLRKPPKAARGTVVFAGPDFKADAEERLAQAEKLLGTKTTLALRGMPAMQVRSKGWSPLPGAAAEAKDIHKLLNDSSFGPVKTYVGAAALEEVLKAMRAPRILHLATHGFFLDHEPANPDGDEEGAGAGWAHRRLKQADNPLLRSGIVLAGANTVGDKDGPANVEDGWVTAEEIALLNLHGTELVVLSACQTGLGDIKTGEGVYGLRRAFLYAGARTLLTSLFEVPDSETRDLMNRFYGGLKSGQGKLDALHAAQLEMVRQRRSVHGTAHPFFWASFVLVGDPD